MAHHMLSVAVINVFYHPMQVNDINAADACFDHNTIVTGDDFGLVKLFRYPCIKKGMYIFILRTFIESINVRNIIM